MDKQFPKDYFQLVQDNERLLDKPLKTKQLTYFQDAMLRFGKNKYNVVASIILLIFVLMSIFVPMITNPDFYTKTNSQLKTLPPRVPILEKIGIMDGTKEYRNQPIDYTTIDPETGLGYPTIGFNVEFIDFDSLQNEQVYGSERSPQYIGGVNKLYVNASRMSYAIQTPINATNTYLVIEDGAQIVIDLEAFEYDGELQVYFLDESLFNTVNSWDQYVLLDTVTTAGVHTVSLDALTAGDSGVFAFRFVIPTTSEKGAEHIIFNSIVYEDSTGEAINEYTGYPLAAFSLVSYNSTTENGRFLRQGAVKTIASFRYDVYAALFSDVPAIIGNNEYQEILEANPGMADSIVMNPDDPDGESWTFGEGYPLTAVTGQERKVIAGREYINFQVLQSGTYSLGFDTQPFFLFGTDVFGKDLFTLIWLGLRTSLLLGFMASVTNIVLGVIWGATSAYYGGQVDILMERFTDIWGSFPQITMIGIITVLIGPGFLALYIFMVYDGWIGAAKITRLQFYRYKGREYVLAARTLGASDRRIIFKHILPNALGTIVTRVILSIPFVIFLEVNLSFLGFGIGNGSKFTIGPIELTGTSIGVILFDGQQQILAGNLWMIIYPTIIVSILMITFNMFGNALRDALNPQLRGSE